MTESTRTKQKPDRECCKTTGLIFPDRRKRCARHQTATERALIVELDRSAKPILGAIGWPYGADIDIAARQRLIQWADARHVVRGKTSCQGLHWLRTGRCDRRPCPRIAQWMDHVTHWKAHGGPALILAQPYHVYNDGLTQLGELAAAEDLTMQLEGDGWYGYGTVSIELWRTDAHQLLLDLPPREV